MTAATELVDKKLLRSLVPLNGLSKPHFDEVARKGVIEQFRAGKVLFKQGKRDSDTYFLLSGEISLLEGKEIKSVIAAGSEEARHPLAPHQPRQFTARVKSAATLLRIDTGLLDVFLAWDQSSAYEVTEIQSDDDEDWMTRMLRSDLFARLPASNIQQIIMRMEALEVEAGTVIVEQDGEGDYYYIIKQGVAMVTRRPSANARPVKVAELRDGDSFGEEALVSGGARNATVTMVTDGALMRLAKADFDALLRAPLIKNLSFDKAKKLVAEGAIWIDVRLPGEYANSHLPGSINVPLAAVREASGQLDSGKRYVVCCDSGTRSAGAAFLLNQSGFDTYVLDDGLRGVAHAEMSQNGEQSDGEAEATAGADIIDFKGGRESAGPGGGGESPELRGRLGDLQQEVVRLRAELAERDNLLAQKEHELEEGRLASDTAGKQLHEVSAQFDELSQKISTETTAREQVERENQELQDRLAQLSEQQAESGMEAEERVNALQSELGEIKAAYEAARAELKSLRKGKSDELAERDSRIGALEAEHAQLDTDLQEQTAARESAEQTLESLREQQTALERQLDELRGQLDARGQDGERLESELTQARERAEERAEKLGDQVAALDQERTRLEEELQQQVQARSDLEGAMASLEQEVAARKEQSSEREQSLEQAAVAARQALEQEQMGRQELEQALAEARSRMEALEGDKERLELEFREQGEVHDQKLRDDLQAAREELERQQAARQELEASLAELRERGEQDTKALTEQVAALEQDKARLEAERGAEGDARAQELQAVREELEQQQAARQELEASLAELRERGEQDTEALTEQVAALEQVKAELESELQRQREARDEVAQQQSARAEAHAARVAELQNNVDGLKEELALRIEERDALNSELAAVRQAQEANGQEINERLVQLEHDNGALESRLAQQSEKLTAVEREAAAVGPLRADLEREQLQRQELESSQKEIEGQRAALQEQLDQLKRRYETETHDGQEQLAQLQQRNEELTGELDRLGSQVAGLESGKADAESSFQALEAEVENWKREVAQAEAKLQAVSEQAERDAERAGEELARLHRDLEGRNDRQVHEEISSIRAQADKELVQASEELKRLRQESEQARQQAKEENAALRRELEQVRRARDDASHGARVSSHDDTAAQSADRASTMIVDAGPSVDESVVFADEAVDDVFDLARADQRIFKQEQEHRGRGTFARLVLLIVVLLLGAGGGVGAYWYLQRKPVPASVAAVTVPAVPTAPSHRAPPAVHVAKAAAPHHSPVKHATAVRTRAPGLPANSMRPGRTYRDFLSGGGEGPVMVQVPPGRFAMGISDSFPYFDERPQHTVTLRGFSISKYEVTFAEYDRFANATGRRKPNDAGWGRGNRPVVNVSWGDAVAYTKWLSTQTGHRYRLATEAQWEYAARAGTTSYFWWGDSPGHGHADCFNCGSRWDGHSTAPVGSFKPNALGLFDTAGNVMEWVQDCYHDSYAGAPRNGSAWSASTCSKRVVRGGSYRTPVDNLRSSARQGMDPDTRLDSLGFRVVREP